MIKENKKETFLEQLKNITPEQINKLIVEKGCKKKLFNPLIKIK